MSESANDAGTLTEADKKNKFWNRLVAFYKDDSPWMRVIGFVFSFVFQSVAYFAPIAAIFYFLTSVVMPSYEQPALSNALTAATPFIWKCLGIGAIAHALNRYFNNSTPTREMYLTGDRILSHLYSMLVGGFAIYLLVIKLQPQPLFWGNPEPGWWSATSVLVAMMLGLIAFVAHMRTQISDLSKNDAAKKIEKELEGYYKLLQLELNASVTVQGYSAEQWKALVDEVANTKDRRFLTPALLRSWAINAWRQNFLDYAVDLCRLAYEMDPKDVQSRLAFAHILLETSRLEGTPHEKDRNLISELLDITLRTDQAEQEREREGLKGKLAFRQRDFPESEKQFVKIAPREGYYGIRILYLLSLFGQQRDETAKDCIREYRKDSEDERTFVAFMDLMEYLIEQPESQTRYETFCTNFLLVNSQTYNTLSRYERYSLFNAYLVLEERHCSPRQKKHVSGVLSFLG